MLELRSADGGPFSAATVVFFSLTKLVVATGLTLLAAFFAWVSTASAGTSYLVIAVQMVVGGSGMGLTSAPATEAIMGVVPKAKAGVGSAVNDATRLLGATVGVAVIGSVYASLFASRLRAALPAVLPSAFARGARDSVGAALGIAHQVGVTGHPALGAQVHAATSSAFFDGLSAGCLVAAGVSAAGAVMAAALLPTHPRRDTEDTAVLVSPPLAAPAAAEWRASRRLEG